MATTLVYGAKSTATCTLASLANGSARECTAIVNTGTLALDYMLQVQLKTITGTHAGSMAANVYLYGSIDATGYDKPVTGTDAAVTISTGMNIKGPYVANFGTSITGLMSSVVCVGGIADIFGGKCPPFWGVVVENQTGLALSATAGDNNIFYVSVSDTA